MSNTSFPLPPKVPTALVPTPIVDGRDPQIERLRVVIREQLMNEQIVDLARIARQLGKSTRTMQRHIAARGTSTVSRTRSPRNATGPPAPSAARQSSSSIRVASSVREYRWTWVGSLNQLHCRPRSGRKIGRAHV